MDLNTHEENKKAHMGGCKRVNKRVNKRVSEGGAPDSDGMESDGMERESKAPNRTRL